MNSCSHQMSNGSEKICLLFTEPNATALTFTHSPIFGYVNTFDRAICFHEMNMARVEEIRVPYGPFHYDRPPSCKLQWKPGGQTIRMH
jgi:hypothetical protein